MGLRLAEGIDEARFERRTGVALDAAIDRQTLHRAEEAGYLRWDGCRLVATADGRRRLDSLLAALVL